MKIFSKVLATFNSDFTVWLPPLEELQNFIEQLSGFEIFATEKDGELSISGSLEAIVTIKDALYNFVQETEQEEFDEDGIESENSSFSQNEISSNMVHPSEPINLSTSENDASSTVEEGNRENKGCLNIEVFHSKLRDNTVKKDFKFSCSLCSFKSQRESHYERHMNLHKTTSTIYRCDECSFSTLRFTHLRRHQVSHSTKTMMCSTCSYSTDDAKLLVRHRRLKHKIVPTCNEDSHVVRNCPACPYQTTRLYLYERHMKVHSAEESKGGPNLFICSQCDYRTTRKIHYVRHVRDVHRQCRPYLCDLCGKAFKRPDALKQHNLLHATPGKDGTEFPFQCHVCNKICHSRAHLKEHQAIHSSERAFLCEICGASFKTRSVQRKHIANLHQNPRAFPCNFCNKRFNTNYALRRHMKQHPSIPDADEVDQSSKVVTIVLPVEQPTTVEPLTLTVKLNEPDGELLYLTEQSESSIT